MRKFYSILFCLLLSIPSIRADYKIIDSKWDPYFRTIKSSDVTAIPKLLIGEEIYFKKRPYSYNVDNLKQFLNIIPDTIWINRKKNPKLNKDYRLMPYYHGIEEEGYAGTIQSTHYSEIENAVFRVDSVSDVMIDDTYKFSPIKFCLVYLYNIKTSERLFWIHKSEDNADLTVFSKTLGAKIIKDSPSFYYSDYSSYNYYTAKTSNYTHTTIINPIFSVNLNYILDTTPSLDFTLSHNYKTLTYPFSSYYPSHHTISEVQYNTLLKKEIEENKEYKIDSKYTSDTTYTSLPFSFRSIYGFTKGGYVNQTINKYTSSYSGKYLSSEKLILIADKQKLHGKNYYIGLLDDKCFYIPEYDVTIPDEERPKLDTLLSCDSTIRNVYFNWAKGFQQYWHMHKTKEHLDELKSHTKYGLSIVSWGAYDESEYTDGTGMKFEFYNPTKKTIKYITINFVGYNAVDDPVSTYEGSTLTRKCIGPIEPKDQATYEFEYVWFTDIVEYAKIKSILVQYKDGTSKRINNASNIVWSDELNSFLLNPTLDGFDCLERINN